MKGIKRFLLCFSSEHHHRVMSLIYSYIHSLWIGMVFHIEMVLSWQSRAGVHVCEVFCSEPTTCLNLNFPVPPFSRLLWMTIHLVGVVISSAQMFVQLCLWLNDDRGDLKFKCQFCGKSALNEWLLLLVWLHYSVLISWVSKIKPAHQLHWCQYQRCLGTMRFLKHEADFTLPTPAFFHLV